MAEEKPRDSLSSSKDSIKAKNPFSRVKGGGLKSGGGSMRKSWSTNSLSLLSSGGGHGKSSCVCAPTKHEGSFRCRLHRSSLSSHGGGLDASAAAQLVLPKSSLSSRAENKS